MYVATESSEGNAYFDAFVKFYSITGIWERIKVQAPMRVFTRANAPTVAMYSERP